MRVFAPLFWLIVVITAIVGYIINIVELVQWAGPLTVEAIIRIIGIFVPFIGSIMGLFA